MMIFHINNGETRYENQAITKMGVAIFLDFQGFLDLFLMDTGMSMVLSKWIITSI